MKTITIITVSLLSILCLTDLQAQNIAIGGKAGFTASSFRGDDAVDLELRKGAVGGAFVNVMLIKFLAIQPELMFKQNGATYYFDNTGLKESVKMNYLQVPVLFKLQIPIDNTFYPHILVGPQYSYALSREYSVGGSDNQLVFQDADIRRNDVGGVFGAGLDVRANRLFWTIDFRYGMGALNIEDNDNIELDLRNQDFTISTGLGILIGRK